MSHHKNMVQIKFIFLPAIKFLLPPSNSTHSLTSYHYFNTIIHMLSSPRKKAGAAMEVVSVKCECCGLREDCTEDYIRRVKASFDGKWLCGLCSEVVRDESSRGRKKSNAVEEAIRDHMFFCSKSTSNPAVGVADGMRQMLRRRSGEFSKPPAGASPKKYERMGNSSQVGGENSAVFY